MQRYELVEGTSSKFWEVEVTGADLTVCFGRLGTAGQRKTKTFADAQAAQKEWHKLVKEKTGKGYGLVSQGAGALPALSPTQPPPPSAGPAVAVLATPVAVAVASNPAQAATSLNSAAAPKRMAAAVATAAATDAAGAAVTVTAATDGSIAWPSGGFRWKDAWRDELPVVRSVHVPERVKPPQAALPLVPELSNRWQGYEAQRLAALASALGHSWVGSPGTELEFAL